MQGVESRSHRSPATDAGARACGHPAPPHTHTCHAQRLCLPDRCLTAPASTPGLQLSWCRTPPAPAAPPPPQPPHCGRGRRPPPARPGRGVRHHTGVTAPCNSARVWGAQACAEQPTASRGLELLGAQENDQHTHPLGKPGGSLPSTSFVPESGNGLGPCSWLHLRCQPGFCCTIQPLLLLNDQFLGKVPVQAAPRISFGVQIGQLSWGIHHE